MKYHLSICRYIVKSTKNLFICEVVIVNMNFRLSFFFFLYLSVRLVRARSCCSNFNFSLVCCCWFCVNTSLRLFSMLVEIHLMPLLLCWLARSIWLATNCCRINMVTFDNLENIFETFSRNLVTIRKTHTQINNNKIQYEFPNEINDQ